MRKRIGTGRLPHAFMIFGGDRDGRTAFVDDFAKTFFSYDDASAKRIENDAYEDLIRVEKDGEYIKVEQIAALISAMRNKPFFAEGIMAVIDDGEAMTEESQNKLLKSLEEPNPGNLILILCENPFSLQSTLRSRCVPVNLKGGAWQWGPEYYEAAKSIISAALFDQKKPLRPVFDMLEPYCGDVGEAKNLLGCMEVFLRDLVAGGFDPELVIDGRTINLIEKTGRRWEKTFIKYVTIIEAARLEIERKMNRKYCLRAMAVKFRQETFNG